MLLFVCGFPSGGTDLAKTVLNAHPDIYLNGEMPRLRGLTRYGYSQRTVFRNLGEIVAFRRVLSRLNVWSNITNLRHDFAPELAEAGRLEMPYVLKTYFADRERLVWGNKTPQNTENIGVLSALFPDARFLVVTRDVRDVCLSWRNKWGKDVVSCAHKWATRMQDGWRYADALPTGRCMFIRYEDLLSECERVCRDVCAFLQLPFSAQMLEHHRHTDDLVDGKLNYGQQINPHNTNKWLSDLSPNEVQRIEEIAYDTMQLLGYKLAYTVQPRTISTLERLMATWNDARATLLVGNRASRENRVAARFRTFARQIGSWLSP